MLQAFFEDARSNAEVDKDARLFAFDIDGVALTAAGEYGKLKNGPPLSAECLRWPGKARSKFKNLNFTWDSSLTVNGQPVSPPCQGSPINRTTMEGGNPPAPPSISSGQAL